MGLGLEHRVHGLIRRTIGRCITGLRTKTKRLRLMKNGGIVGIGHHRVLRRHGMGMPDHLEQGFRHPLTIHGEIRIEDLVPTMLRVGLGEHQ